jgi:gamma-glutamyltranspeptidase/glutathione hydrolase
MPERMETTHFSVIDKWGNAVSNTYTINGYFGSGVVVAGAGFLLNDEMDDFSAKPGVANMFGVVGSDANAIAPFKRPLSSMSPTILTRDGRVALVLGTPGGSRIFTTLFQVIENVYSFQMPLDKAVGATRFHHQLLPANTLFWEPYAPIDGVLAKQVEARGYILKPQAFNGDVQAIQVEGDTPVPVADPRGRGVTMVVP